MGHNAEDNPWDLEALLDLNAPSPFPHREMLAADGIVNFMDGNDRFLLVDPTRVEMQSVSANIPKAAQASKISTYSSLEMTPGMHGDLTTK